MLQKITNFNNYLNSSKSSLKNKKKKKQVQKLDISYSHQQNTNFQIPTASFSLFFLFFFLSVFTFLFSFLCMLGFYSALPLDWPLPYHMSPSSPSRLTINLLPFSIIFALKKYGKMRKIGERKRE